MYCNNKVTVYICRFPDGSTGGIGDGIGTGTGKIPENHIPYTGIP